MIAISVTILLLLASVVVICSRSFQEENTAELVHPSPETDNRSSLGVIEGNPDRNEGQSSAIILLEKMADGSYAGVIELKSLEDAEFISYRDVFSGERHTSSPIKSKVNVSSVSLLSSVTISGMELPSTITIGKSGKVFATLPTTEGVLIGQGENGRLVFEISQGFGDALITGSDSSELTNLVVKKDPVCENC